MGSGLSLLCQSFLLPAPHPRALDLPPEFTQSELLIINSHRGWCQVSSLDMETRTALENNLLFMALRRRTHSFKEEKTCLVWLQPLPEHAHISQEEPSDLQFLHPGWNSTSKFAKKCLEQHSTSSCSNIRVFSKP